MSTTSDSPSTKPDRAPIAPPGTTRRSARREVWPLVRRLHFYAGVFVAPFLALAALTGLAYAFTPQFDAVVYSDELRVDRVAGARLPLADQVRAAMAVQPGTVATVVPPAEADASTQVVLSVPGLGEKDRTVYVDPYTGRVLGVHTTWSGSTPMTAWLDELHRSLHLGTPGRLYSETAASWLWVIVTAGAVMWLGRRRHYRGRGPSLRAFRFDRSAKGVRRTRSRHAVTGVWLAAVLLFLSATGLTWSDHAGARFDTVQEKLRSTAPKLDTARPGTAPAPGGGGGHHGGGGAPSGTADPAADVDTVLATARRAGMDGPVEISTPEDARSVWSVAQVDNRWPVRRDKVAVDASTGRVTDRVTWAETPWLAKLSSLGIQFHMGRLFGLANQILLGTAALGLLGVIFWGYRTWWRRRPVRADRRASVGRPPARGAWRRLPRPLLLLGVPAVLLVGWAVPMLGITLVAFLAIDGLLGALRRRRTAPTGTG
ncbi:putative iron-regulated membrane protein [Actinomadura pelletieri DSM 43383]|uniref:Putative iron-regulated membrane protein n=1 Tax=Actinomadura pelletieri DSM 43383 TaxID=1120940 RepID=A0A495QT87_9ACTN|nr:PepSY domain-containing protein [Actinomadura pelletieri]RKS76715.1 putative iron-regulated membrane protein [Actinomadura pelletieri DSM 43383]